MSLNKISEKTLNEAYKPYDIVDDFNGSVGFIQEVSINECQPEGYQVSYAVKWLVGNETKHAWFDHLNLRKHCNLFEEIAKCSCHPMGHNSSWVKSLMKLSSL